MTDTLIRDPHWPDRLVRQAEAFLQMQERKTALEVPEGPLSMIGGLRIGGDSVYASGQPVTDVACGYIGGDTPHVWSYAEWASRPERWRLPIYVRSYPGNGSADGAQAKQYCQGLGMPAGAVIGYDLEQLQDAPMCYAFAAAIAPYVCMVYGAESYVRANPPPWWEAAWNNVPNIDSANAWAHQYFSDGSYDLNVFSTGCPLWDRQGPPPTPPAPVVVADDEEVVAYTTQLLTGEMVK